MSQGKNEQKLKFLLIINIFFFNLFSLISIINHKKCDSIEKPIDYELKNIIDNCYLTIHNLISINTTNENMNSNGIEKNISTNEKFKSYIYSYSKPYLLELIQNSTDDCLCCNKIQNN